VSSYISLLTSKERQEKRKYLSRKLKV